MTEPACSLPSPDSDAGDVGRWLTHGDRCTARRSAAQALHPDVGGSATALARAFAEIDAAYGGGVYCAGVVTTTAVHRTSSGPIRAIVRVRQLRIRRIDSP